MRQLLERRTRRPGNKSDGSTNTKIPIEFGECAPILRQIAQENDVSVSTLVGGMVALMLQE
jgi:hypothetical protein